MTHMLKEALITVIRVEVPMVVVINFTQATAHALLVMSRSAPRSVAHQVIPTIVQSLVNVTLLVAEQLRLVMEIG